MSDPEPNPHRQLSAFLHDNDAPCPSCGYNLKGVVNDKCPECGTKIALGVIAPNKRFGPWLVATIACAMAVGFDWVAMILVLIPSLIFGPPPMGGAPVYWKGLLMLFLLGFTSGIGLFFMLRSRNWWQSSPVPVQWSRSAILFLAVFVIHAAGGAWIVL